MLYYIFYFLFVIVDKNERQIIDCCKICEEKEKEKKAAIYIYIYILKSLYIMSTMKA